MHPVFCFIKENILYYNKEIILFYYLFMIRNILVFGAQGSGKGTQAELLAQTCESKNISIGNIFRREVYKKTALGLTAKKFTDEGKLVPDNVVNEIVASRLTQKDIQEHGVVLEGYPRNSAQAEALEKVIRLTDVVVIDITDSEAVNRISKRLSCVCGKTYNIDYNAPQVAGICDECGQKLFIRDDDKPEAIRHRLEIYHKETEPVFAFYEKKGILHRVNGEQKISEVYKAILKELGMETP